MQQGRKRKSIKLRGKSFEGEEKLEEEREREERNCVHISSFLFLRFLHHCCTWQLGRIFPIGGTFVVDICICAQNSVKFIFKEIFSL